MALSGGQCSKQRLGMQHYHSDRVFMVMPIHLLSVTVALSSISVGDIISGAWRAQY